ncbi:5-oxoprolinase subunit PxpA [Sungkyunkwania multivorans]|uniref:5-oxoprolinase subunit PxpA n=1 Tax=Sungkyunkwania multivorans TaxID=1173618 RepID=A0ABW3CX06_9FLAO
MQHKIIDINSDLGEGMGNDAEMMRFISSCNIACGGHYGDETSMSKTIRLALDHNVRIGAHPSFPDKQNFGRLPVDISSEDLKASLYEQLLDFKSILDSEGGKLHHIKPHGALYNLLKMDMDLADLFLDVTCKYFPKSILYVSPDSSILERAEHRGARCWIEAFADRNYNDDLSLVPRSQPDAVIENAAAVLAHVNPMILKGHIKTVSGNRKSISPRTLCVHGDHPNALEIARALNMNVKELNITIG